MPHSYRIGDETIPGFRLTEFLGRGGFGQVWKACAPGGTEVALKFLPLGRREGLRELKSLRLVKRIRHPHLVPITGFWLKDREGRLLDSSLIDRETDGLCNVRATTVPTTSPTELIIMMGLGEKNLLDRLYECQRDGQDGIPPAELIPYMEDAAKALDYLNAPRHNLGSGPVAIQHCDVKPQNLILVGSAVQVCDFGLARVAGDSRQTQAAFSLAYAAPEVLNGDGPGNGTDQYSLAISYVELRTGGLPIREASSVSEIANSRQRGEIDLSGLDAAEAAVIQRATELDPRRRFESCGHMVRALRRACGGLVSVTMVNEHDTGRDSAPTSRAPAEKRPVPSRDRLGLQLSKRDSWRAPNRSRTGMKVAGFIWLVIGLAAVGVGVVQLGVVPAELLASLEKRVADLWGKVARVDPGKSDHRDDEVAQPTDSLGTDDEGKLSSPAGVEDGSAIADAGVALNVKATAKPAESTDSARRPNEGVQSKSRDDNTQATSGTTTVACVDNQALDLAKMVEDSADTGKDSKRTPNASAGDDELTNYASSAAADHTKNHTTSTPSGPRYPGLILAIGHCGKLVRNWSDATFDAGRQLFSIIELAGAAALKEFPAELDRRAKQTADRGLDHLQRGEFRQAVDRLTAALRSRADDAMLYYGRGRAYTALAAYGPALADMSRAQQLADSDAWWLRQAIVEVEVTVDRAALTEDGTIVGQVTDGERLVVKRVDSGRLWVETRTQTQLPAQRRFKCGWIDVAHVSPRVAR